jgi:hypothetical protein
LMPLTNLKETNNHEKFKSKLRNHLLVNLISYCIHSNLCNITGMKTYTLIKIGRAEYQVIDENGSEQFAFPTSKHKANLFITEYKTDERFLSDPAMQKVAKKYINDTNMPVSAYGDLRQFMLNSIYKMYHGDIRKLMTSQSRYREHLRELSRRNYTARQKSIDQTF